MKKTRESVIELRQSGRSYDEICAETGYSKGGVSYICRKHVASNTEIYKANRAAIEFTDSQLAAMRIGADKYYAKLKEKATSKWTRRLDQMPREFVCYIAGLYDGDGNHRSTNFDFSNSDMDIITCFVEFVNAAGCDFSMTLYLHKTHDKDECLLYWSPIVFDYVYQYDNRKQKSNREKRFNFGTVKIRVNKPLGLRDAVAKFSYSKSPLHITSSPTEI